MVEAGPAVVGGEAHGRMGASVLLQNMNPTTQFVLQMLLLLGLAVFAVAVVDVLFRGRFKQTAFVLTGMLALLAPLMGIFAAANGLFPALVEVADQNIMAPSLIAVPLAEGALSVAAGAFVGGLAVILNAVLKLADARRPAQRQAAIRPQSSTD